MKGNEIEAISKMPNDPISVRPAVLKDGLEEIPTFGRDSSEPYKGPSWT